MPTDPPVEYQPVVIGPDGKAYWSTPIVYEPAPWPVFVKGQGDPISDLIAGMINDMIVCSPVYTPPNPWVRKSPEPGTVSYPAFDTNLGATPPGAAAAATPDGASTPSEGPAPASTSNEEFNEAYPDWDAMIDAVRDEFIRQAKEAAKKRAKEAKDKRKKDKEKSDPNAKREHIVGNCWCGQNHPDHVRFGGKCWCGREGIHAVGTGRD